MQDPKSLSFGKDLGLSTNELNHVSSPQRALQDPDGPRAHIAAPASNSQPPTDPALGPASFRNVSACNRCRLRKHRCDQRLPKCHSCEKAQVRCVGYDPITKQEIPRSYVYFLENRVKYLNNLLSNHEIKFKPVFAFEEDDANDTAVTGRTFVPPPNPEYTELSDGLFLDLLLGRTTRREILRLGDRLDHTNTGAILRGFFFGLGADRSGMKCTGLPCREEADKLVDTYFTYVNPKIPALTRVELQPILDHVYTSQEDSRSSYKLFFLFIIFATGASVHSNPLSSEIDRNEDETRSSRPRKKQKLLRPFATPEQYHASAMAYLERALNQSSFLERFGDLEELQVMIMLAIFALHRTTSPGLGYLVDVAMRSAIDLRLYCEHNTGVSQSYIDQHQSCDEQRGNQHWVDDLRRRLWWCVYSLERLVAQYLNRPFFIPDEVITTEFPSLLDDDFITISGFLKMRILQSEIHSVVQYQRPLAKRDGKLTNQNRKRPSYLAEFTSFSLWRMDMNQRLDAWKGSVLAQRELHSWTSLSLLELEYWQAILMLYRWSVNVPTGLVGCSPRANDIIQQLSIQTPEESGKVCLKVAQASQKVLQVHRVLRNVGITNGGYLKVHEIFVAGSIFMFTLWDSENVRSKLTLQDLDYSVLAAASVLEYSIREYPSARDCRDVLEQMGRVTTRMCLSTPNLMYPFLEPIEGSAFGSYESPRQLSCASPLVSQIPHQNPVLGLKAGPTSRPYLEHRIDGSFSEAFSASSNSEVFKQGYKQGSSQPGLANIEPDRLGHLSQTEWLKSRDHYFGCQGSIELSTGICEDTSPHCNDQPDLDGLGLFSFGLGSTMSSSDAYYDTAGYTCTSNQSCLEPKGGPRDMYLENKLDSFEGYIVGWGDSGSMTDY